MANRSPCAVPDATFPSPTSLQAAKRPLPFTHWRRIAWYLQFAVFGLGNSSLGLLVFLIQQVARKNPPVAAPSNQPPAKVFWRACHLFFLIGLLSALLAKDKGLALVSLTGYAAVVYGTCALARELWVDPAWTLKYLPAVLLSSTAASALLVLYKYHVLHQLRPGIIGTGVNGAGTVFALALVLGWAYLEWLSEQVRRLQLHWLAMLGFVACWLLTSFGLLFTFSRGAWLGFAVGMFVYLMRSRRSLPVFLIIGSVMIATGLSYVPTRARITSVVSVESNLSRIQLIETGVRMIRDYPLLGVGPGNFAIRYEEYKQPDALDVTASYPHNLFLNIATANGLLGLVSFLALLGTVGKAAGYGRRGDAHRSSATPAVYLMRGATASLAAVMCHQMLDNTMFGLEIGALVWLFIGVVFWGGLHTSVQPASRPA